MGLWDMGPRNLVDKYPTSGEPSAATYSEDGKGMFLRNVGTYTRIPNISHTRRRNLNISI
jgi:hypothetical protein